MTAFVRHVHGKPGHTGGHCQVGKLVAPDAMGGC